MSEVSRVADWREEKLPTVCQNHRPADGPDAAGMTKPIGPISSRETLRHVILLQNLDQV